ncbi:MAG TPA: DEAD/DEAH box helicase [Gammaproteobacteria bacterium]|nr:DEAD/DEAH box helicase [Gammaproteobacteria bacterium]
MVSKTNEQALEAAIQKYLTGTCLEEMNQGSSKDIAEPSVGYGCDYTLGLADDFNPQFAVDTAKFWQFLEATQADELDKLRQNNPDWQRKILERFDRLIKKHGLLHLLKKGLAVDDAFFHLMYPAPLASSSKAVVDHFAANLFSVSRQIRYSLANPAQEIDMVLFINGIALITIELKNPWTGQTARFHGQKQYREDRDPHQPLLQFARCLVHLAVDTDEVYMTTKLAGKETFFLPFNQGHNHGAGNPPNTASSLSTQGGHKTAYLWEAVLSRKSLANIIQHFVRLDGAAKDPMQKRTLFFPRYHQLDVVRKLIADATENGAGQTYLIQHSAGSGKSNSITWAAFQLIEVYQQGQEEPLFDSVIVVTDRRLLDKQLRNNIKDFSEVKNIVAPAHSSKELRTALESGKKIIITTIQKFPFIIEGISDLSDKRFAVIIDEAHSSQSGSAHDNMNRAMGKSATQSADINDNETLDVQEKIIEAMQSRKMRGNASYLAFTATPKNTTLEKFGQQQADGSFEPFHLYSMKQAIEEGFILDVLANYTTYKSYYEIQKSIRDNPEFDTGKAQKQLRAYVERSQQTINTKADIMLEHFISRVVNAKKLRGKAKGMVITQNIEAAIRYYNAIRKLLEGRDNPFKVLIAFSGEKDVDGITYTEAELNGVVENKTSEVFDSDEYRLLIVANKYLTGFDQPKLCTLYADKKLQGVLAVQALSRLNRSAMNLGKKTEDLFVLDFFNTVDDIKTAFDPFYTATSLSEATDVNVLHELKDMLDEVGVYEVQEIEAFVSRFFNNEAADQLSPIIDVAASRFNHELTLENDEQIDFKIKAKQFVKIYGQIASIMPFELVAWEKLFWFLKFLIPKLMITDPNQEVMDELLESVDLSSYGLERVKLSHTIGLDDSETEVDPQNPNPRGNHNREDETDPLDEIIRSFNERWFQGWSATPEEQRIKILSLVENVAVHPDFKNKYRDNPDPHNSGLAFEKMFQDVMLKLRKDELEFYKLYATDNAFKTALTRDIERIVNMRQPPIDQVSP